ncbi:VOC family protein [Thiomonas sp. FB-Cd]|uniref:VOC family protein n=1 Tax=Thiomonas sp. FB-Cd TaxID=1158292 RepID=UPI0004DFB569|nr:VOC family protein [Thiomonas sp. FB-Cd]
MHPIAPFLWFDDAAEAAAAFYVGVFPNSRILALTRYGDAGHEQHGRLPGSVMTVAFELNRQRFTALNGGPSFCFTPAVSFAVHCRNQDEIDHYWELLSAGGEPGAQQCSWLQDRFGLSWQIIPDRLPELLSDADATRSERVMQALLGMKKLDLAALERAANAP